MSTTTEHGSTNRSSGWFEAMVGAADAKAGSSAMAAAVLGGVGVEGNTGWVVVGRCGEMYMVRMRWPCSGQAIRGERRCDYYAMEAWLLLPTLWGD